jgi:hypothetical protein
VPIVILDLPLTGKLGVNSSSVTQVTEGPAGRVYIWQGAKKTEVIGTLKNIVDKLNAKT